MPRGIPSDQLTANGTIKAVYERDIVNPKTGKAEFGVGDESFEAICSGYACGSCLEYGEFRGSWLPTCPTCGEPTGAAGGQVTSEWWLNQPKTRP